MDKINKVMTTSEIDKKFNKKWVLVKNPTIKNGYMKGGLVLFSGGRKELLVERGRNAGAQGHGRSCDRCEPDRIEGSAGCGASGADSHLGLRGLRGCSSN